MYEQIAANKRATVLLFTVVVAVLLGLGFLIGLIWTDHVAGGLVVGSVLGLIALLWGLIGHFRGGAIVLAVSRAREVDRATQPQLCNVVEEMAIAAGLPLPTIYVIDDPAPNALTAGRDPAHAAVAVTSGLLATLKRQELQGVIAHEMAHVRNYDIRFATLVAVMVGLVAAVGGFFLGLSAIGFRAAAALGAAPRRRRRRKSNEPDFGVILGLLFIWVAFLALGSALAAVLAYPAVGLLQMAISRRREYLADASAVQLSRDPLASARALEKIAAYPGALRAGGAATAHLYIASPFGKVRDSLTRLFDTHPPIEKRIAILREIGHESKQVEALQDAPKLASKTQATEAGSSRAGDAGSRRRRGAA